MGKRESDGEAEAIGWILGLSLLALALGIFWCFKGMAIVVRAFAAAPANLWLWSATFACLITAVLALVTNGNAVALVFLGLSALALYVIAAAIVAATSQAGDAPASLDDVIKTRW